ncbi:MAG TPA: carboxypeptidase-like regulatory domain-containing protein, partial [Planctomycetota bacterium]|nr:carboxypeptidase-like regulatory domain-containing protein [Planctomycetota bacterium]
HVPTLAVPRLHELVALVRDADGLPLAGARVRGWGGAGGRVEATSDPSGLARQPWIPAGRVTLEASLPERPEAGHVRVHLDFPTADGAPLELHLRR